MTQPAKTKNAGVGALLLRLGKTGVAALPPRTNKARVTASPRTTTPLSAVATARGESGECARTPTATRSGGTVRVLTTLGLDEGGRCIAASPARGRRMRPFPPREREPAGGGEDQRRGDGGSRTSAASSRTTAARRLPRSRERSRRAPCWSREPRASWNGRGRDGGRVDGDYEGELSVRSR